MKEIVFVTYQTGFKDNDKLMEIGAVELDENCELTGDTFHTYINPQRSISRNSTQIYGLNRRFLKNAPIFEEIKNNLLEFIVGKRLIIPSWEHDLDFLEREFGFELPNIKIDINILGSVIDNKEKERIWHQILTMKKAYIPYRRALENAYNHAIYYRELMKQFA